MTCILIAFVIGFVLLVLIACSPPSKGGYYDNTYYDTYDTYSDPYYNGGGYNNGYGNGGYGNGGYNNGYGNGGYYDGYGNYINNWS